MRVFAMQGSEDLGRSAAAALSRDLDPHEEREFEDGEHKSRPLVSVRGEDVYVIACLTGDASKSSNDRLVRLLFFLGACRENGARRVTAVAPYLPYSRKDRQTKRRDPVTTRYVAQLFESVEADCVVTIDAHNVAAFQNAFRRQTVHLEARRLFVRRMREIAGSDPVTVFSPDAGGIKRAQLLRETYEAADAGEARLGFMEKRRSGGVVSGDLFAGDVDGSTVFILDDMISTGGTMLRAAAACRDRRAKAVHAVATHGLFREGCDVLLNANTIDSIIVTDSVAPASRSGSPKVEVTSIGPLIGATMRRLNAGEPLGDLLALGD